MGLSLREIRRNHQKPVIQHNSFPDLPSYVRVIPVEPEQTASPESTPVVEAYEIADGQAVTESVMEPTVRLQKLGGECVYASQAQDEDPRTKMNRLQTLDY